MKLLSAKAISSVLIFISLLGIHSAAQATLIGDEVTANWTFTPNNFFQTNTFTVTDAVELPGTFGLDSTLDITADSIIVDVSVFGIGTGVTWDFLDLNDSGGGVLESIFVSTNYSGYLINNATFNNDSVHIFFSQAVVVPSSGFFEINLFFANSDTVPVPEPSTLALLSLGLLGVGFAKRRHRL